MALTGSLGKLQITPRDLPKSFPIILSNICSLSPSLDRRTFVSVLRSLFFLSVRWDVLTTEEQIFLAAGIAKVSTTKPDLLQLNPLFSILNELNVKWRDLFLRIPIVLKYVIFRTFSTLTLSLSSSLPLPQLPSLLPLSIQNNKNNDEKNRMKIDNNFREKNIENMKNKNDNILKNPQNAEMNAECPVQSLLVLQSSILVLLENMVGMGASGATLGDKAIFAISETVYTILKSSSYSFPSSTSLLLSSDTNSSSLSSSFSVSYNKLLSLVELSIKNRKNEKKIPIKINTIKKFNSFLLPEKIIENVIEDKNENENKNENELSNRNFVFNDIKEEKTRDENNEDNLSYNSNDNKIIGKHENEIWMEKMFLILTKLF